MSSFFLRTAGVLIFAAGSLFAGSAPLSLNGPEVIKIDWNTRSLQAVDLRGTGLNDLVLINNDHARIDFLLQKKPGEPVKAAPRSVSENRWEPIVEDSRYEKSNLSTGITMFDLVVADVNGDGRPDLIYTGDPDTLTVRYQQKDGTWGDKKVVEIPAPTQFVSCLKISDLNADGRNDLAILTQKELVLIYQNAKGELDAPQRFALADENCYSLQVVDVNGDGRPDLVYLAPNGRDLLRIRLQNADHSFGPERAYKIDPPRGLLRVLPGSAGQLATFVYAAAQTGQLTTFVLEKATDANLASTLRPRVYSPQVGTKTAASYAFGDFNGDGLTDLAVADADGAQIFVYLQQPDGEFAAPQKFPSLPESRSLASGRWDDMNRDSLFVMSTKEQMVGVATFTKEGRLSYPQPLVFKGKPLAITAGKITGTRVSEIAVAREESGKRFVDVIARAADGKQETVASVELVGLKTDPKALRIFDANQDGLPDIAVFTPFESMRLVVQKSAGVFEDATSASGFRKGLVDNLDPSALTLADVTGDGKPELLVAGTGFVRALRLAATGELTVVDQFNARDANAEIAAALPVISGISSSLVLLDKRGESFQILRKSDQGVYQYSESVPSGKIELVGAEVRRLGPKLPEELFFFGKDRFWRISAGTPDLKIKTATGHTTDLKDINYGDIVPASVIGANSLEAACVDPDKNLIEVLSRQPDGTWESKLHFKVFESDSHYQGRRGAAKEPREILFADVTGDGKKDLVILIHNRVLVYPQE